MKKTIRKNEKGITLIALIITIIVLIILAGISIMMISGNDGILARAGNAKNTIGQATAEEEVKRAIMSLQIDGKGSNNGITPAKIAEQVNKDNGRTDVTAEGESFPTNIVYGDGTKVYVNLDLTIGMKKENKIYSVDVDEKDIHDDIFVYDEFVKASETEISSTGTLDELPKNTAVITGIKPEYINKYESGQDDDSSSYYGYKITYSGITNTLVIPSTVEKDGVQYTIIGVDLSESINDYHVAALPDIKNIIFPNTLKTIRLNGESSTVVVNIVLPESITELPSEMFAGYKNLQSINIPNGVTSIGYRAFYDCKSLQSIIIPNSVTEIGEYAFWKCSNLQSVTISNKVTNIGLYTFADCSNLQNITIPNSVKKIEFAAFDKCSSLKSIIIPNSVTEMDGGAFEGCSSLQSIIIPDSVTSMGGYIDFRECKSLTNITIPDGLTGIDKMIFYDCTSLTNIKIPDGVTKIDFSSCSSLTSITIPNSVTEIGGWDFYNCLSLQNITIPDSVTKIGNYTFYYCTSLQNITIPKSVTEIGNHAFENCTSLNKITINKPKGSLDYSEWGLNKGTTIVWNDGEETV